jgi:hypothetical protein
VLTKSGLIGQTLSIALAGAIFAGLGGAIAGQAIATQHLSGDQLHRQQHTFVYGFHITFLICAAIAAIGIFTSLVRGKEVRRSA